MMKEISFQMQYDGIIRYTNDILIREKRYTFMEMDEFMRFLYSSCDIKDKHQLEQARDSFQIVRVDTKTGEWQEIPRRKGSYTFEELVEFREKEENNKKQDIKQRLTNLMNFTKEVKIKK
jgi:hypothetical protein